MGKNAWKLRSNNGDTTHETERGLGQALRTRWPMGITADVEVTFPDHTVRTDMALQEWYNARKHAVT